MIAKSLTVNISKEIYNFTQKFFKKLSGAQEQNFRELFRGIALSGSTHLAKISRVSNTGNRERSDIERLSNTLEKIDTDIFHKIHITNTLKTFTEEPILIFSDGGDIQKPTAKKMEKVCFNVDGSNGHKKGRGYPAHATMAYGVHSKRLRPLSFHIHSTQEEGFKSEFSEQKKIFECIFPKTNTNIKPSVFDRIIVEDRGCDSEQRFLYFLNTLECSFVTRVNPGANGRIFSLQNLDGEFSQISTQQLWKNQKKKIFDTQQNHIPIPSIQKKTWFNKKLNKECESIIAFQKVFLPSHKNIPLFLISVFTEGYEEPLCVLTDLKTDSFEIAWKHFFFYKKRWEVENLFRSMKQNFDLEKFQILSFKKIKALTFLVLLVKDFFFFLQEKAREFLGIFYQVFEHFCKQSQRSGTHHLDLLAFLRSVLPINSDGYSFHSLSSFFHNIRSKITSAQASLFDFRQKHLKF